MTVRFVKQTMAASAFARTRAGPIMVDGRGDSLRPWGCNLKNLTRRAFMGHVSLTAGAVAFQALTPARAKAAGTPKRGKPELIRALQGVHNFMITPFHAVSRPIDTSIIA